MDAGIAKLKENPLIEVIFVGKCQMITSEISWFPGFVMTQSLRTGEEVTISRFVIGMGDRSVVENVGDDLLRCFGPSEEKVRLALLEALDDPDHVNENYKKEVLV